MTPHMTTREKTADHAELARIEDVAEWFESGDPGANGSVLLSASVAAEHARDLRFLLSEIAALRGERDGLKNRVSCLERLGGEQSTRVMEQATRAKDAERQRDELRKALEPFAALADKFGCWSVVEVCAPEPGNKSPVIQPLPLSAFETAAALIANQGADQ